ncbi:unnamed protein product [Tuber aestivum]|uniref:Uncharacterized protein n=1 Tax=Tuber aestivum TaxID=59557 RepID=A0A292PTN9_9PEZI|nr:unnamed protein product [Tuber aestivum]
MPSLSSEDVQGGPREYVRLCEKSQAEEGEGNKVSLGESPIELESHGFARTCEHPSASRRGTSRRCSDREAGDGLLGNGADIDMGKQSSLEPRQDGDYSSHDTLACLPSTLAARESTASGHGDADTLVLQFRVRIKHGAEAECEVKSWRYNGARSGSGSIGELSDACAVSITSYEGPMSDGDDDDVEEDIVIRVSRHRRGLHDSGGHSEGLDRGNGQVTVEYFVHPSRGGEGYAGPIGDLPTTVSRARSVSPGEKQVLHRDREAGLYQRKCVFCMAGLEDSGCVILSESDRAIAN